MKRCAQGGPGPIQEGGQLHAPFMIVPVTRQQFTMLGDRDFLNLISIFGIESSKTINVYPKIVGVQVATLKEQLQLMKKTVPQLLTEEQRQQADDEEQEGGDLESILFDLQTLKQHKLLH